MDYNYIIYNSSSGSADSRSIVGYGMTEPGEEVHQSPGGSFVAVAVSSGPSEGITLVTPTSIKYVYDTTTDQIRLVSTTPYGYPEPVYRVPEREEFARMELRDTEWTQLADAPLTAAQKNDWASYRSLVRQYGATLSNADMNLPPRPSSVEF